MRYTLTGAIFGARYIAPQDTATQGLSLQFTRKAQFTAMTIANSRRICGNSLHACVSAIKRRDIFAVANAIYPNGCDMPQHPKKSARFFGDPNAGAIYPRFARMRRIVILDSAFRIKRGGITAAPITFLITYYPSSRSRLPRGRSRIVRPIPQTAR